MPLTEAAMPASPPSPKKAPHSGAYLAFGRNLDYIADLNALRRREIAAAKAALLRTQTNFKKHSDLTKRRH